MLYAIFRHSQNFENRLLASYLSVRPSVRMEQLGSHWTDFHEIWYLSMIRKTVQKIQVSLKADKNDGTVHEDHPQSLTFS